MQVMVKWIFITFVALFCHLETEISAGILDGRIDLRSFFDQIKQAAQEMKEKVDKLKNDAPNIANHIQEQLNATTNFIEQIKDTVGKVNEDIQSTISEIKFSPSKAKKRFAGFSQQVLNFAKYMLIGDGSSPDTEVEEEPVRHEET